MLITAHDGELLGIRVMWRIKHEYIDCQFTTLRVELNDNEIGRDITDTSTDTAEFDNGQLDCNRQYRLRVQGSLSQIENVENGIPVFYGGNSMINILNHAYMHTLYCTPAKLVWLVLTSYTYYYFSTNLMFTLRYCRKDVSSFTITKSACWTFTVSRQKQYLLGPSSLSPSEWY